MINDQQKYLFLPHGEIIECIEEVRHPFRGNHYYVESARNNARKEFERCHDIFAKRVPGVIPNVEDLLDRFMGLSAAIGMQEDPYKDQLEELAKSAIVHLFDIPDHIVLSPTIEPSGFNMRSELFSHEGIISPERRPYIQEQIEKRRILNGLAHGSALHIWKTAFHIVREELNSISRALLPMYGPLVAYIGIGPWMVTPNMALEGAYPFVQGVESVSKEKIEAQGLNFPQLLHELTKGVVDYLIRHGLPKDVTSAELEYIYQVADNYEEEPWHYLLSPQLWLNFVETLGAYPNELPEYIMRASKLSYSELSKLMLHCSNNNSELVKRVLK